MPVFKGGKIDYDKTTLPELVAYCQARGLDASGVKAALTQRIEDRDAELKASRFWKAHWTELAAIREWHGLPKWYSKAEDIARVLCDGVIVARSPPQFYVAPLQGGKGRGKGKGKGGKGDAWDGGGNAWGGKGKGKGKGWHDDGGKGKGDAWSKGGKGDAWGGKGKEWHGDGGGDAWHDNDAWNAPEPEPEPGMFGEPEDTRATCGLAASLYGRSATQIDAVQSAWEPGPELAKNVPSAIDIARKSPILAGENVVYASGNGGPVGNDSQSFIAITTTSFFRVHDNKLYTRVALADIAKIGVRRGGFLREDKIVFGLANGAEDTAGIAIDKGPALDEYMRILGCVLDAWQN